MGNLWGAEKKPTPKELMKQSERAIKRACRDLDRERANLEKREKQMQADIKKNAQKGQMVAAKHIAKDVVRTRNQITKTYRISAQLQSVQNKLTSMKATHATTEGMDKVCQAMVQINKQYDMAALNQMAQDFSIESDRMDMMADMTDDIIGDMLENDADADGDEDTAADEILNSVMDAEGIKMADQFGAIPTAGGVADAGSVAPQPMAMGAGGPPAPPPSGGDGGGGAAGGGDASLAELEARMDALRRGD